MIKANIVANIVSSTGLEKKEAESIVNHLLSIIKKSVGKNEAVYLRKFGTFKVRTRHAKPGRDIRRNKAVQIPEHHIPWFKACKDLQNKIKLSVPVK